MDESKPCFAEGGAGLRFQLIQPVSSPAPVTGPAQLCPPPPKLHVIYILTIEHFWLASAQYRCLNLLAWPCWWTTAVAAPARSLQFKSTSECVCVFSRIVRGECFCLHLHWGDLPTFYGQKTPKNCLNKWLHLIIDLCEISDADLKCESRSKDLLSERQQRCNGAECLCSANPVSPLVRSSRNTGFQSCEI